MSRVYKGLLQTSINTWTKALTQTSQKRNPNDVHGYGYMFISHQSRANENHSDVLCIATRMAATRKKTPVHQGFRAIGGYVNWYKTILENGFV